MDKIEEESQMRARLKLQQQQSQLDEQAETQSTTTTTSPVSSAASIASVQLNHGSKANANSTTTSTDDQHNENHNNQAQGTKTQQQQPQGPLERFGSGQSIKGHWLGAEIDRVCAEQLSYARQGVGEGGNGWQLFADEGEMKMYRREEEVNGMVIDPLKACHVVKGVSAREMCHYFYSPEFRNDWESE